MDREYPILAAMLASGRTVELHVAVFALGNCPQDLHEVGVATNLLMSVFKT